MFLVVAIGLFATALVMFFGMRRQQPIVLPAAPTIGSTQDTQDGKGPR